MTDANRLNGRAFCMYCGRNFPADGSMRCRECRERSKVREHQLALRRGWQRRFRNHDCALCRKHRKFVKALIRRWDERGIYVKVRCHRGHIYQNWGRESYCSKCYTIDMPRIIKSLGVENLLSTGRRRR